MVRCAPDRYAMCRWTTLLLAVLLAPSCTGIDSGQPLLTAEMPLHLEEHLAASVVVGSEVPEDPPGPVEWLFDEPQPDWKPVVTMNPNTRPVKVERTADALRLMLDESNNNLQGDPVGGIVIDLPEWSGRDWGSILVRARASEGVYAFAVGFNTRDVEPGTSVAPIPYALRTGGTDAVNDGTVQSYLLRMGEGPQAATWDRLGLWVWASEPATFEVLSVSVILTEADYADAPTGTTRTVSLGNVSRQAIYSHAPGRLEYRVRVPEAGRLDLGLRVLRDNAPVFFEVTATPDGGETQTLLEETYDDAANTSLRSVDLSHLAGQTVTLALGADSERPGTVALWATPTLSGARNAGKPNIVLYVIDGGGAEYMSVYGYNRRTTPNLERLAAEGALFERAYSNAFWSQPSTMSFMTALHNSVLGGVDTPMPEQAVTMAQHLHDDGYQTAVFTGNPLAGRRSSLDRGVDALRDEAMWYTAAPSSFALQQEFWRWREAFPGQPFWVHFQTVDVHSGGRAMLLPPFGGLYLEPARRAEYLQWERQVGWWYDDDGALERFEEAGVDPLEYYDRVQRVYSEGMAAQDHQIGKLVERLKRTGEWSNTLLIVAADHGQFETGLVQLEPYPPLGQHTNLRPERTRVPMIFVWPGHIAGGQRFTDPVSMIDMLPTVLDLADLPPPEVMQGQSLAPLLLGTGGWEPRPVILDEFYVDSESGELRGWLEVIDGRWGASLAINPHPEGLTPVDAAAGGRLFGRFTVDQRGERPAPLLLYDLWNDPYCLNSLHEERPDLVERYTELLEEQWAANEVLAQRFPQAER